MSSSSVLRLGLVQLSVGASAAANLQRAASKVSAAAAAGARLVALPECFNSPYGVKHFPEYAEAVPDGDSCRALAKMAKDNKVYLLGGSIPERDSEGRLFNTSTVWSPQGEMIAKFRKIHLFDIDVPGKITFKESDALSPGNELATFDVDLPGTSRSVKVGLGICYDIRFAELARVYADRGCQLIVYPGAFNMTTGPAHWELLARGRALDNQLFVATVSPARDEGAGYVAWGHSTVVDPWGSVVERMGHGEDVKVVEVDAAKVDEVRGQIPVTVQRRKDLFQVNSKI